MSKQSTMSPNACLAAALLAAGWSQTHPFQDGAYRRDGAAYLTWRKGPVTIASSATERELNTETGAVDAWLTILGDCVTLEVIQTEVACRSVGAARQAISEWVNLARQFGVRLYLEPWPQERGVSRARLIDFYLSAGFMSTDRFSRVMVLDMRGRR